MKATLAPTHDLVIVRGRARWLANRELRGPEAAGRAVESRPGGIRDAAARLKAIDASDVAVTLTTKPSLTASA